MTRINVVPVTELTDQHLMAEYRELPMVMTSACRSSPSNYIASTRYTLNKGHVSFFYNKKQYLLNRWLDLIAELHDRGFNINPESRRVLWNELNKFPQTEWQPSDNDLKVNRERIQLRISAKPHWYRYRGKLTC